MAMPTMAGLAGGANPMGGGPAPVGNYGSYVGNRTPQQNLTLNGPGNDSQFSNPQAQLYRNAGQPQYNSMSGQSDATRNAAYQNYQQQAGQWAQQNQPLINQSKAANIAAHGTAFTPGQGLNYGQYSNQFNQLMGQGGGAGVPPAGAPPQTTPPASTAGGAKPSTTGNFGGAPSAAEQVSTRKFEVNNPTMSGSASFLGNPNYADWQNGPGGQAEIARLSQTPEGAQLLQSKGISPTQALNSGASQGATMSALSGMNPAGSFGSTINGQPVTLAQLMGQAPMGGGNPPPGQSTQTMPPAATGGAAGGAQFGKGGQQWAQPFSNMSNQQLQSKYSTAEQNIRSAMASGNQNWINTAQGRVQAMNQSPQFQALQAQGFDPMGMATNPMQVNQMLQARAQGMPMGGGNVTAPPAAGLATQNLTAQGANPFATNGINGAEWNFGGFNPGMMSPQIQQAMGGASPIGAGINPGPQAVQQGGYPGAMGGMDPNTMAMLMQMQGGNGGFSPQALMAQAGPGQAQYLMGGGGIQGYGLPPGMGNAGVGMPAQAQQGAYPYMY